jgi:phosphopantothenoylcysteine decarboxylase/phosphopantothenate--cysteine ligase
MCDAVLKNVKNADALIMAAAVADYRPAESAPQKIKKNDDELNIPLAKTTDILQAAQGNFVKVGFAAESQNLVENAKSKVASKGLDLIVANDITDAESGFGTDTNKVSLIDRDLNVEELPLLSKYDVSNRVLDRVLPLFRD